MKIRKIGDRKPYVVIFQGSPRDPDTCPNMESKTHNIVNYVIDKWSPFIDFKLIDLSVNQDKKPIIQPCKGCVSTAGGYHCHWQCSCFVKGSKKQPDLLKDLDVYTHLELCDAFLIFSPIHWHSLTTQVKALFDRLVCANLTLTVDDAKKIMGDGNIKNSEITGFFSKKGNYDDMLRNHLEGKFCGFYAHGDAGADEYPDEVYPPSYQDVFDDGFSNNAKNVVMPFVMQMKYSGVYVPDDIIEAFYINRGKDYYLANIDFFKTDEFLLRADKFVENLLSNIDKKSERYG